MDHNHTLLFFVGGVLILLIITTMFFPDLPLHLRAEIAATMFNSVTKEFVWAPAEGTQTGDKTLTIEATDQNGSTVNKNITITVLAATPEPTPEPTPDSTITPEPTEEPTATPEPTEEPTEEPTATPTTAPGRSNGGGSGGSGGGGGNGGGGEDRPSPPRPKRTASFQVESSHTLEGAYSSIINDGGTSVARIAHGQALLSKDVQVEQDDYWLYVRAKHDRPGPVNMAIYINNRAWKVIRLDRNDNRYYTHRVGLLRNFSGANVHFRIINDVYDKNDPSNQEKDRDLFIDWWQLSTDENVSVIESQKPVPHTTGSQVFGARSNGWTIMPRLNTIIREELGSQHVTFATWNYYAWRLGVRTNNSASIRSEEHLRNIMRFWKGASPTRPFGERI